jgi:hypothetical protein
VEAAVKFFFLGLGLVCEATNRQKHKIRGIGKCDASKIATDLGREIKI